MKVPVLRGLVLVVLLAGCTAPAPRSAPEDVDSRDATQYQIGAPERLAFSMPDGVELVATLWRPEGLDRAPVILHSQPYASGCSMPGSAIIGGDPFPQPCRPPTSDPFWLDWYDGTPRALIENGFAYVDLNVRGTGESGGCLDYHGPTERRDIGLVLDELASAEWSTGSIGMMGVSYMGTTPFVALGHRHPALKAVVAGGINTNDYYAAFTPQGAGFGPTGGALGAFWYGSVVGPQLGGGPSAAPGSVTTYPERLCPEFVQTYATAASDSTTEQRDRQYFLDRRHSSQLKDIDAAVLVVQGIPDRFGLQWEPLWEALGDAPKSFVLGDWGHQFPDGEMLAGSDGLAWPDLPLAWFDHYLRGGPLPQTLDRVHYQVLGTDNWHEASAWPALAGEALYLGDTLTPAPGSGDLSFVSTPNVGRLRKRRHLGGVVE